MELSTFRDRTDRVPAAWETDWPGFCQRMTEFEHRERKDGPLMGVAEYPPGSRRAKKNVVQVHVLGLDLDKVTEEQMLEVLTALNGISLVYHTTWSNSPAIHSYRVFVELSRPVLRDEWPSFWKKVIARHGRGIVDASTKDASRMFYWPSAPVGAEDIVDAGVVEGEPLDVDDVLSDELKEPPRKAASKPEVKKRSWEEAEGYMASKGERAKAKQWLKGRCDRISTISASAPIYKELNETAFFIATRVPHLIDEEKAESMLWSALKGRRPDLDEIDPSNPDGLTYRQKYEKIIIAAVADARTKSTPWFPDSDRIGLNEHGLAHRCALENYGQILFVPEWGKWMAWTGTHWLLDASEVVGRRLVIKTLLKLKKSIDFIEDEAYGRKLSALVTQYLKSSGVRAILSMMQTWEELSASADRFNQSVWLLNLKNGVLDLRNGTMQDHDPEMYITKYVPIEFKEDAECPRWERFVLECMDGNVELVEYLRHAVGYSLTGSVQEHCLFFLYGDGRNGKTTFINTLMYMLGGIGEHSYARRGVSSLLLAKRFERHPTEKTPMFGARVMAVPELEENRSWSESTLKELTGGEQVTARRMREDFWTFVPTHKFWVSGNSKPRVRGTDDGIWSRLKLIPFEVSFKGREDRALADKLKAELPGILTWAIIGAIEWFEQGLAEPEIVTTAVNDYRHDEDLVSQFATDKLEWDDQGKLTRTQMRRLYDMWCQENGVDYDKLSSQAFTKRLRRMGLEECRQKGVRSWKGARVKKMSA